MLLHFCLTTLFLDTWLYMQPHHMTLLTPYLLLTQLLLDMSHILPI